MAAATIENPADYDKQECEQKAFKRLAERLKSFFPRLRICIHADGLYPNAPFFEICQANDCYNLSHKFSRVSAGAMKNYVSLMQVAHLLNQLYELSPLARRLLVGKETLKNMWKDMISSLTHAIIDPIEVLEACSRRIQIRYQ